MKYIISGHNIDVTDGIRAAVESKLGKLDKYLKPDTEATVTLSVEKDRQKIEVTIPVKGNIIRAEEVSTDMYASIDLIEETIERQIRRYRKKLIDRQQAGGNFTPEYIEEDYDDEEDVIKIVRSKKFGIKPMDAEEACVQMELLGHSFFVFLNTETDEVNVVYKRKDGAFGLIEPELD